MRIIKVVLLGLIFFGAVVCNAKPVSNSKKVAATFLNDWLIHKNLTRVRKAIAKEAFSNKRILSDDCVGMIGDEDRTNPKKVEKLVMRLLKEITLGAKGRSLKSVLVFRKLADEGEGKKLATTNLDGYLLIEVDRLRFMNDDVGKYLVNVFPSEKYLMILATVNTRLEREKIELPIYFVLRRIAKSWKIIHVGTMCP